MLWISRGFREKQGLKHPIFSFLNNYFIDFIYSIILAVKYVK